MHPVEHLCCQNSRCPDAGRRGHGNLTFRGYSGKRKGTVLEQARLPDETVHAVLDHIREGCGTRATSRLVKVDKNTVTRYIARAGAHAEPLHRELVAFSPRDA